MMIFDARKNGAIASALCGVLLLFVSLAGADDKKKDKDHSNNSPTHQSHQPSNSSKPQNQGYSRGNQGSQQGNTVQNPRPARTYQPQNDSKFKQGSNPNNNYRTQQGNSHTQQPPNVTVHGVDNSRTSYNKAYRGGESDHAGADSSRRGNFAEHDRGKSDFRPGPRQQEHVVREAPRTVRQFGDRKVAFDHGGHVREIHARDMEIHRGLRGERTFVAERHGVRIVSVGRREGYLERRYASYNGRVYVQRTYVVGGVRYARAYRTYYWHGAVFYHYAPAYYYHPVFYTWAFNPWPRPVYYRWGWTADPWYPAYGYYFAPYPVYPTASLWLTDYLLAENLRLAYESRQNAEAAAAAQQYEPDPQDSSYQTTDPQNGNTVQLSPEVKQMIADEVQRQLAAQQAASANQGAQAAPVADSNGEETPAALDPNHRVFVVAGDLDVVGDNGQECTLTAGDVILRTSNTPDGSKVSVNVITSKRGDCPSNTNAAVEVSDLQEMQNHFREQMDSGLKALADNQGKSGLPSAPDTSTTGGEVPAPKPDANAETELQDQQKSADGVENAVKTSAQNPGN